MYDKVSIVVNLFFSIVLGLLLTYAFTYRHSELDFKEACEKLGQFYIDDVVYECKVKGG